MLRSPLIECPITLLITGCRKARIFVKKYIERWTQSSGKVNMIFRKGNNMLDIILPLLWQPGTVRVFFPSFFQQQLCCCVLLDWMLDYILDYSLDYSLDYGLSKITHLCEKTRGKVIKKFPKGNNMLDIILPLLRQPGTVRVFFPSFFQQQLCCCVLLDWMLDYILDYLLDYSLDYGLSKITHLCEKARRKVIKKFQKGNKEIPER